MSNSEIRKKLNKLKMEAASELNMQQYVKENNDHDKSELPSKVNGAQGGPIGGRMVKKMIESEKNSMNGN